MLNKIKAYLSIGTSIITVYTTFVVVISFLLNLSYKKHFLIDSNYFDLKIIVGPTYTVSYIIYASFILIYFLYFPLKYSKDFAKNKILPFFNSILISVTFVVTFILVFCGNYFQLSVLKFFSFLFLICTVLIFTYPITLNKIFLKNNKVKIDYFSYIFAHSSFVLILTFINYLLISSEKYIFNLIITLLFFIIIFIIELLLFTVKRDYIDNKLNYRKALFGIALFVFLFISFFIYIIYLFTNQSSFEILEEQLAINNNNEYILRLKVSNQSELSWISYKPVFIPYYDNEFYYVYICQSNIKKENLNKECFNQEKFNTEYPFKIRRSEVVSISTFNQNYNNDYNQSK